MDDGGCDERLTWQFIRWSWEYPKKRRPGMFAKPSSRRPDQRAIVLRSMAGIETFLRTLPTSPPPPPR